MQAKQLTELQKIINYKFKNTQWVTRAFTHSSIQDTKIGDYERLEFLGDRVLGLIIAESLCVKFPNAEEGELSVRFNALVNAEVCAQIACDLNLPHLITMGPEMHGLNDRRLTNIYADVIEALIAALYLDGGLEIARQFIIHYWAERLKKIDQQRRDAKTELQEWAHQQKGAQPLYRVIRRKGPDHDPIFEVEVRVSGFAPALGKGGSKRLAEREAAKAILCREGVWQTDE